MSAAGVCSFCGFIFQRATGKFCGKCGARRQQQGAGPQASPPPPPTTTTTTTTTTSSTPTTKAQSPTSTTTKPSTTSTIPKTTTTSSKSTPPPSSTTSTLNNTTSNNNSNSMNSKSSIETTPAPMMSSSKKESSSSLNSSTTIQKQQQQQSASSSSPTTLLPREAFTQIEQCLKSAGLSQYLDKFIELSINDESMPYVEEEDLNFIKVGAHRRLLLSAFTHEKNDIDPASLDATTMNNTTTNNSNNSSNSLLSSTATAATTTATSAATSSHQQKKDETTTTTSVLGGGMGGLTGINNDNNAAIQTLKMPEDGGIIPPNALETANAETLRVWRKGTLLGRGSFGSVYSGLVETTGSFYAVKCIGLRPADPTNPSAGFRARDIIKLSREIAMMRRLKHRNICQFYGCVYNNGNEANEIQLFLELLLGGTLRSLAATFRHEKPLPPQVVRNWVQQLVHGVAYLHEMGVAHRDLKCDNVMVSLSSANDACAVLKLVDFGAAKKLSEEAGVAANTITGSPYWISPEVLMATAEGYDALAADIWSLGITICEILKGIPWPEKSNIPQAILMIAQNDLPTEMPSVESGQVSKNCDAFIRRCLVKDPKKRPTAKELLKDSWIKCEIDA